MGRDCQQVRDLLDSYLSDELLVETNHELLRHVGGCRDCSVEMERRRNLRRGLLEALQVEGGTDSLEARILTEIESTGSRWRRLMPRLVWVGAAGMVLIGVEVLWTTTRSGVLPGGSNAAVDDAVYRDSMTNHRQCALSYPADLRVSEAVAARQLRSPFEELLSSIDLEGVGQGLIDAHVCRNGSRTFAHVILDGGGRPASLFAIRKSQGALPPVHEIRDEEFQVAAAETEEFFVLVISELPREENARLASRLLPQAVRFLRGIEE